MVKFFITIIALVVLCGMGIWGIDQFLSVDDLKDCQGPSQQTSTCEPADAIVAISGGDTQARTDEAIALYRAGWAPEILFSGAALDTTGPSNAAAMRRQALAEGVPDSAIIIDEKAEDTTQNAARTFALLGDVHRIILVTSPYHQRRASVEFSRAFGKTVTIVNHPTSTDRLWPQTWWLTASGWGIAVVESAKTAAVML